MNYFSTPEIKNSLSNKFKAFILFSGIFLISFLISKRILEFSTGITLGSIGRLLIFCLSCLIIYVMISNLKFASVIEFFNIPQFNRFNFILLLGSILIYMPFLIDIFNKLSPFIFIICILVIGICTLSFHSILNGKLFNAILLFLVNIPFNIMVEKLCGNLFHWNFFNVLDITPTIAYLGILFFLYLFNNKDEKLKISFLLFSTIFLIFAGLISVVVSSKINVGLNIYLMDLVYPAMFFYLLLKSLNHADFKKIHVLLVFLIVIGLSYVFLGYYSILWMSVPSVEKLFQIYGELGIAANYKIISVYLLPFTVALAMNFVGIKKYLFILAIFFEAVFLLGSFSRIAVIAACLSIIPFIRKKEISISVIAIASLIFVFRDLLINTLFFRFSEFNAINKFGMSYWSPMRLWGVNAAYSIMKDYPIFGIGYGMWNDYYFRYGPAVKSGEGVYYIAAAHNAFLDTCVQGGILFLFAIFLFLFAFLRESICLFLKTNDKFVKDIASAFFGFIISVLVVSFAGNVFSFSIEKDFTGGILFFAIVAILIKISEISKKFPKERINTI